MNYNEIGRYFAPDCIDMLPGFLMAMMNKELVILTIFYDSLTIVQEYYSVSFAYQVKNIMMYE